MAQLRSINFTVVRLAVMGGIIVVGIFTSFYTVSTDFDLFKFLKSSDAEKTGDGLRDREERSRVVPPPSSPDSRPPIGLLSAGE